MQLFSSADTFAKKNKKATAITIGNYDGVHLGHQQILTKLCDYAKKHKLVSLVYTFTPHPVTVLAPKAQLTTLQTDKQKIELITKTGVDALVWQKFDLAFAKIKAYDFFTQVLVKKLNAKLIRVGHDFTFGTKREGHLGLMAKLCDEFDIRLDVVKPVLIDQTLVSSSLIRQLIQKGDLKTANKLLGRPYFLEGKVMSGAKRGAKLGFATANLQTEQKLWPQNGVYATFCKLSDGKVYPSVTNIGFNPTFKNQKINIETHLLDFNKTLYQRKLKVYFLDFLRSEKRFQDEKQLTKQIQQDILKAKKIHRLNEEKP